MTRAFELLLLAGAWCSASTAQSAEFYLSPQGDDRNSGTLERPFQTLGRGQAAARAAHAKGEGAVTVWLRGGRYELSATFTLTSADSGVEGRPVVYRCYGAEQPVLSGGTRIGGWKPVQGDLPGGPVARGTVWTAEVPSAQGTAWTFRQLWANGRRLPRARWPNLPDVEPASPAGAAAEDPYRTRPVASGEVAFRVTDATLPTAELVKDPAALERWRQRAWTHVDFAPADLKAFQGRLPTDLGGSGAELFSINRGRWATMRVAVAEASGTGMTTTTPIGCLSYYWGGMHLMSTGAGHLENALSLLDRPGEWYLEKSARRLYYLAGDGENPNTLEFIAPRLERLVSIQGTAASPVRFVELRGLSMEHAQWRLPEFGYRPALGCYYGTQLSPLMAAVPCKAGTIRPKDEYPEYCLPAAVELTYAERCRLELCRVAHVGASGVGLGEGCRSNVIVGCEVADAGGHGIHVGMVHGPICGEDFAWRQPADEPHANEVVHCHVHHTGEMDWGAYGILASYCRKTRIAHNLVEQQPYSGIAACFTWFAFPSGRDEEVSVERNHIRHVLLKLMDGGGIYTKDGVDKSSALRGNLIHDVGGGTFANNGLFLDDGSYGFHIQENVIYNVKMPIRFNNTSKERFTWGTNYLNDANYPRDLAAKAGPQEPYRSALKIR